MKLNYCLYHIATAFLSLLYVILSAKIGRDTGRRYKAVLFDNKHSVTNAHRCFMAQAQNLDGDIELVGTVVHVIRRDSHKYADPKQSR